MESVKMEDKMEDKMEEYVILDGQEMSYDEFQEACSNLTKSQKLVETSDKTYVTLSRMSE